MKKYISITIIVLIMAMALCAFVACNPTNPDDDGTTLCAHVYSGDCDVTCNTCGEERVATASHTDTTHDGACDLCGATTVVPNRYTLQDAGAWNDAISFAKSPNYRVVSTYETAAIDTSGDFDVIEMIFESDGVTNRTIYNYYKYDENGERVFLSDMTLVFTITKLSDGTYWKWGTEEGIHETATPATQEEYDDFYTEISWICMYYDEMSQFAFNTKTNTYQMKDTDGSLLATLKFENDRIVGAYITMDGVYVETIVTYGETETIDVSYLLNNK